MADESAPQLLGSIQPGSPAHRQLVASLKRLRDNASSDEDLEMYEDILNGKRSVREVLDSRHFNTLATKGFRKYTDERAKLSSGEREEADRLAAVRAETFFEPDGSE